MEETKIKIKKEFNWESLSLYIFYGLVFLLPIFFLKTAVAPVAFGKSPFLYCGVALAFIFWLFARLQKGEIKFPKSGLFLAAASIIAVWFVSSVFSFNPSLSFVGTGYEIGTFVFFLFMGISLFLASIFFQDAKRVLVFYLLLLSSAFLVFLFQLLHTVFGITLLPFGIFNAATDNLIGGWNDFAIFFGFIALSSLCLFELSRFSRALKTIFAVSLALSILAMLAVNFSTGWIILGFFVLVFLVYVFSNSFYSGAPGAEGAAKVSVLPGKIVSLPLFVLLIIFFFILARGMLGDLTGLLNTSTVEVRPSWTGTFEIVGQTLKANPVLGSGPNTFLYDWLKYKPASINSTIFWASRFQSGVGHLPSMAATAGILGALSLLAFLSFLLFYGLKVFSCVEGGLNRTLLITSFFGSLYLWAFTIFYSPGFLIFALAFLVTGILVGMLVRAGKIKTVEISFLKNPKAGFISVLVIVILMIGAISGMYFFFQKYRAARAYTQALVALNVEGNLDKGEQKLSKAAAIDPQDRYYRALSDIGIARMRDILSQKDLSAEILRAKFQNVLGASIQNAQRAVDLNPLDPLNLTQLGRIYESVVSFDVSGADKFAVNAYEKALELSPLDPTPLLGMARVKLAAGDADGAREYIKSALDIKGDFAAALFLLAQIEAREGNLDKAIQRMEQTVFVAPNDIGALFQLGILYYKNKNYAGARAAFERTVSLNPSYSNARYFLGLVYDKQGEAGKAIEQFEIIKKLNPGNAEIEKILKNLRAGRSPLRGISPPAKSPDEREQPPISDETEE